MIKDQKGSISILVLLIQAVVFFGFTSSVGNAPINVRDTQRITELHMMSTEIINADLMGEFTPKGSSCISYDEDFWFEFFDADVPTDPDPENKISYNNIECTGEYLYSTDALGYWFFVAAKVEDQQNGNIKCEDLEKGNYVLGKSLENDCYVILIQ